MEGSAGRSFNTSLTAGSAKLESVARITRGGHLVDGDGNVTRVYKVSAILCPKNPFQGQVAVLSGYTVGARLESLQQKPGDFACTLKTSYARETNNRCGNNEYDQLDRPCAHRHPNEDNPPLDTRYRKSHLCLMTMVACLPQRTSTRHQMTVCSHISQRRQPSLRNAVPRQEPPLR